MSLALQADSLPAELLEKPRPTLGRESSARMKHSGLWVLLIAHIWASPTPGLSFILSF